MNVLFKLESEGKQGDVSETENDQNSFGFVHAGLLRKELFLLD